MIQFEGCARQALCPRAAMDGTACASALDAGLCKVATGPPAMPPVMTFALAPLQVDGQSHVVHSEEEALGTRLTIDSLTCLLANETDPSKLLAISPGKLMRYLVPDESTVVQDQPYAEIEVGLKLQSIQCPGIDQTSNF